MSKPSLNAVYIEDDEEEEEEEPDQPLLTNRVTSRQVSVPKTTSATSSSEVAIERPLRLPDPPTPPIKRQKPNAAATKTGQKKTPKNKHKEQEDEEDNAPSFFDQPTLQTIDSRIVIRIADDVLWDNQTGTSQYHPFGVSWAGLTKKGMPVNIKNNFFPLLEGEDQEQPIKKRIKKEEKQEQPKPKKLKHQAQQETLLMPEPPRNIETQTVHFRPNTSRFQPTNDVSAALRNLDPLLPESAFDPSEYFDVEGIVPPFPEPPSTKKPQNLL